MPNVHNGGDEVFGRHRARLHELDGNGNAYDRHMECVEGASAI